MSRGSAAAVGAAAAACLYLAFPAARYNFDGVACAIAVELGDLRHLAHGNHLAYGILGRAWFLLWKALGYSGPAILSLQALSSVLGAAGVSAFAALALGGGLGPLYAALGACGLMVSGPYWAWSLEAQVYPLGAVFLFLAAAELLREPEPRPLRAGLFHGCAVLGHAGHAVFLPAALYLLKGGRERVRYVVVLGGAVLLAYAAAGLFCVRPVSWEEFRSWLLGSAALTQDRSFQWHGGYSWALLRDWLRVSLEMFGGGVWTGLAGLAAAAWGAALGWKRDQARTRFCLLWLACYAALYLSWEPATPVYRITDLAPLWLLILIGLLHSPGSERLKAAGLGLLVFCLGARNLYDRILPGNDPGRNANLQRALWVGRETPPDSWVAADNSDQVYIPYFARRRPIILPRFVGREEELKRRIRELSVRGERVYVVLDAVSPGWREYFEAMRLARRGEGAAGVLYEIQMPPNPATAD